MYRPAARTALEVLSTIAHVIDKGHASVGRNRSVNAAFLGSADGPSSGHSFSYCISLQSVKPSKSGCLQVGLKKDRYCSWVKVHDLTLTRAWL